MKDLTKQTTWINTINSFAEPKKYVALPVVREYEINKEKNIVVMDANSEKIHILVEKSK